MNNHVFTNALRKAIQDSLYVVFTLAIEKRNHALGFHLKSGVIGTDKQNCVEGTKLLHPSKHLLRTANSVYVVAILNALEQALIFVSLDVSINKMVRG
ncbi:hypothetical protein [Vibrio tapetis]|uniref:Uncharacterized protein n=1 Tax=Vibrio tapetis subsp. tapetis TaxID=1671868 RepID=A0A2N8ZIC8_9VIBR|nr:hypothetical protein [Vibrio tapetis]SON51665.1 protein of unknown function [Vibrio tapetis subsp. tapetis]